MNRKDLLRYLAAHGLAAPDAADSDRVVAIRVLAHMSVSLDLVTGAGIPLAECDDGAIVIWTARRVQAVLS